MDDIKYGEMRGGCLICPYCGCAIRPSAISEFTKMRCPQCHSFFKLSQPVIIELIATNPKIEIEVTEQNEESIHRIIEDVYKEKRDFTPEMAEFKAVAKLFGELRQYLARNGGIPRGYYD